MQSGEGEEDFRLKAKAGMRLVSEDAGGLAREDDPPTMEDFLLQKNILFYQDCVQVELKEVAFSSSSSATSRSSSLFSAAASSSFSSRGEDDAAAKGEISAEIVSPCSIDQQGAAVESADLQLGPRYPISASASANCKKYPREDRIKVDLNGLVHVEDDSVPGIKTFTLADCLNQERKLEILCQKLSDTDSLINNSSSETCTVSELDPTPLPERAGVDPFSGSHEQKRWKYSRSCHVNQATDFCPKVLDDTFPLRTSPGKAKHVRNLERDFCHHPPVSLSPAADYKYPSQEVDHLTRIRGVDPSHARNGDGGSRPGARSSTKYVRQSSLVDRQPAISGELVSDETIYGSNYHGSEQARRDNSSKSVSEASACKRDDDGKLVISLSPRHPKPKDQISKSITNRALSYTIKKLFPGSNPAKNDSMANLTPDASQFDETIPHGCLLKTTTTGATRKQAASMEATLTYSPSGNSIAGGLIMHSHLYCSIRDGVPSYTFVSESEYILSAKSLCSTSCDGELMYGLYSLWKNHSTSKKAAAPSLLAKMKVSCKVRPAIQRNIACSSEGDHPSLDLEYVLMEKATNSGADHSNIPNSSKRIFYSSCERSLQSQFSDPRPLISEFPSPKNTRKNAECTETKNMSLPSLTCSPLGSRCSISSHSHSHNLFQSSQPWQKGDDPDHSHPLQETYSEIAAVVIHIPCITQDRQVESSTDHHHLLQNAFSPEDCSCKPNDPIFRISNNPSKVTVILPAGDHGRPMNASCGPQPIIERWRSGGKCDCGSWDLGCGLTILDGQSQPSSKLSHKPAPNAGGIIWKGELCTQFPTISFQTTSKQVRNQEMVWMRVGQVSEGVFLVEFQAHVLPLQAFASAMAVVHSRNPFFY